NVCEHKRLPGDSRDGYAALVTMKSQLASEQFQSLSCWIQEWECLLPHCSIAAYAFASYAGGHRQRKTLRGARASMPKRDCAEESVVLQKRTSNAPTRNGLALIRGNLS